MSKELPPSARITASCSQLEQNARAVPWASSLPIDSFGWACDLCKAALLAAGTNNARSRQRRSIRELKEPLLAILLVLNSTRLRVRAQSRQMKLFHKRKSDLRLKRAPTAPLSDSVAAQANHATTSLVERIPHCRGSPGASIEKRNSKLCLEPAAASLPAPPLSPNYPHRALNC